MTIRPLYATNTWLSSEERLRRLELSKTNDWDRELQRLGISEQEALEEPIVVSYWVLRNFTSKFVPEAILMALGIKEEQVCGVWYRDFHDLQSWLRLTANPAKMNSEV